MDFFPEPLAPTEQEEPDEPVQPAWTCAPHDVLPGVVPLELILGRSGDTVVQLSGMRVFPTGVEMTLSVRLRGSIRDFDLNRELFDGPYRRDMGAEWQAGRLKWGFEFVDGRQVRWLGSMGAFPPGPAGRRETRQLWERSATRGAVKECLARAVDALRLESSPLGADQPRRGCRELIGLECLDLASLQGRGHGGQHRL